MDINQCTLVDWYRFKGRCEVKTCKFFTDKLNSGCLAIERKDTYGKKLLTDRELRYYKFGNDLPINAVSAHRKKMLINVKKVIALYYYIQYIQNNCQIQQIECDENMANLLTKFPLKLKKINVSPVLLANMLIESNFESYRKSVKLEEDFKLNDLFLIPLKKWNDLRQQ